MHAHFVPLLALIPLCFATQEDAVKTNLTKLDGTWQVVYHENNGNPTAEETCRKVQFAFKDAHLTFLGNDILSGFYAKIKLVVDPTTMPRTIDLKVVEGKLKGTMLEGIYELKGDDLKICFRNNEVKNRPTDFSTKGDANLDLFVLKRQKK